MRFETFHRDPATQFTHCLGVALQHGTGLFHQVSVQLCQSQTVGDLWGKVARAASAAKRAPAAAGGGDTEESADTLAAMTAAAAAAVSDQQGNEGGAPDEGGEDGSGSGGGNRQGILSSSKSQACLPQGHVLMRQASVTGKENAASSSYPRALESQSGSGSFLLFSEDAVGLDDCNLRNDDELILVRCKRLVCQLFCRFHGDRLAARTL